jgi:CubicO group peptidase (beta-lactamase class C family)
MTRSFVLRCAAGLAGAALCGGPARAQAPVIQPGSGQRLDSLIRAAEAQGFHGVVLVEQRGHTALLQGYGFANHASQARFTPSTVVQIGSNTKDFTATVIYQLVEEGRLRLTDSLPRFFAGVPSDKRGITVEQLLGHRAGLPLGVAGDDVPLSKADMLERLWALTLAAPPGTTSKYSNLGYSILAAIVEQLTGRPFDAVLAERVFDPAGMRETGLQLPRFDRARLAHGYAGGADRGVILDKPHDADGHLWSLRGNGGLLSTVRDMQRFYQALRGPTLLREEAHRRAVIPFDQPGVWAGSDMTSFFLYGNFPAAETEILIATNHREYQGSRMLREIQALLGIPLGDPDRAVVTGPLLDRVPETGVGRTVTAYLDAYATADTAVMRRFFLDYGDASADAPPIDVRVERFQQMRANLGRLTVRGARQAPNGEGLVVVAVSEFGTPVTMTFVVTPEPPHRLRGIRVEAGGS